MSEEVQVNPSQEAQKVQNETAKDTTPVPTDTNLTQTERSTKTLSNEPKLQKKKKESRWEIGEVVWAKMNTFPWWPSVSYH